MKKLIRFLFVVLASLLVFVSLLLVILFTVIDPNRYRPTLESVFADQTGWQLQIAGDISWSFRPVFGLGIRDVRLSNGVTPQELASFSEVTLSLSPRALLRGQLDVHEFVARNLHVNWYVDSDGQANWLVDTDRAPAPRTTASRQGDASDIPINIDIQQITITNARINVRDVPAGIDTSLENLDISSRNTNLENRPFPLSISTRVVDRAAGRDLPINLETMARVGLAAGNLALDDIEFRLSPVVLNGNIEVNNFQNSPRWRGALASNTFNLNYLLENFIEIDAGPGIDISRDQFTMNMTFSGDERGATLEALRVELDDTRVELTGDVLYAENSRPMALSYRLQASALDLDRYLPADPDDAAPAENGGDEELPFDLLRDISVRGSHTIDALTVAGFTVSNINAELLVQNGVLTLNTQPMGFYGGELTANLHVDGASAPAVINSQLALQNISAETFAESVPLIAPFTGRMDAATEHSLRGDTINELLASIDGTTVFNISNGTADITMLKRVFQAISVLSPSGDIAREWPDVVQVNELNGELVFNNGLAADQQLSLRIDNFDIAGTGGINLAEGRFDYRLDFAVLGEPAPQTIRVNPNYQNIGWPVRCNAAFDSPPVQYCSPDLQRARELFAQIARDEVERRGRELIEQQTERLQDRARSLLDRLRPQQN